MATASDAVPNLSLQDHRRRLDLTQEQVAEALVTLAWEHHGVRVGVDGQMVSKWERGQKRPSRMYRQLLCLLYCTTEEQLGFRRSPIAVAEDDSYGSLEQPADATEDSLNRRTLLRHAALGAAALGPLDWLGQLTSKPASEPPELAAVRDALMRYRSLATDATTAGDPPSLVLLRRGVDRAWAAFQTSNYSALGARLPRLLTATQLATRHLDGDDRLRASGLLAETYSVWRS